MTPAYPGRLIVFEGIDGTGKSTQIVLLAAYLERLGYHVLVTREPTDGVHGRKIRELYTRRMASTPADELALFLADRREHVQQVVVPALEHATIVLCDRYYLSTVAYQGANGFDPEEILRLNSFAPPPDLALLFVQPIDVSLTRITGGRGEQLNDFEQADTLARVSRIFAALDLPYIRRIKADDAIDAVHNMVVEAVTTVLPAPNP